jgi:hypothetical protein
MVKLPGMFLPGTPLTDSVEYAYVKSENPIESALVASALGCCC